MFRDASKSSDTLGASNDKAAQAALQLASAATKGGGALSSLPAIIQQIIAAAQASSAAGGGGGLLGLLGLGGSSSAFAPGGVASSGFGSGVAFGEQDLGLFLHSGGVVGQTSDIRPVPAGVFDGAAKYHTGGVVAGSPVAGLHPHEVPAILMGGPKGVREEVLHADDPRHSDRITPEVLRIISERGVPSEKHPGFSDGGYTGDKGVAEVAGVVHGREYVFSSPAVHTIGRDKLDALHTSAAAGNKAAVSSVLNLSRVANTSLGSAAAATPNAERSNGERVRQMLVIGERVPVAGQRELGGPVSASSLYRVNERGPELLEVGGAQYLMTGSKSGEVMPVGSEVGGVTHQTIQVHVQMPQGASRATAMQWGAEAGRHAAVSLRRQGKTA
jgi:hypothetical protein